MPMYMRFLILAGFLLNGLIPLASEEGAVDLFFFYSDECSFCSEAHPFLQNLAEKYPGIRLHSFEISRERAFWEVFKKEQDVQALSIPQMYIGDKVFFGFLDEKGPLRRHKSGDGYIAYSNQILRAVEKEIGQPVEGALPYVPRALLAGGILLILILLFFLYSFFFR